MTMPTKFERNWDRGKNLERARKHCVQKPMGFGACSSLQSRSFWGPNSVNPICPIDNACNAWAKTYRICIMTGVKLFFLSLFMSLYGPYLVSLEREFHGCYCKLLSFFFMIILSKHVM